MFRIRISSNLEDQGVPINQSLLNRESSQLYLTAKFLDEIQGYPQKIRLQRHVTAVVRKMYCLFKDVTVRKMYLFKDVTVRKMYLFKDVTVRKMYCLFKDVTVRKMYCLFKDVTVRKVYCLFKDVTVRKVYCLFPYDYDSMQL